MSQSSPQFTAAQILEAGRQAEAGGNRDYAIQFYRHLGDNYPHSAEAAGAREALARLLGVYAHGASHQPLPNGYAGVDHSQLNGQMNGNFEGLPNDLVQGNYNNQPHVAPQQPVLNSDDLGPKSTGGSVVAGPSGAQFAPPYAAPTTQVVPPEGAGHGAPPVQQGTHSALVGSAFPAPPQQLERDPPIPSQFLLPTVRNYYRMGQFLATVLGIVGWIMLMLGVAAILAGTDVLPGLDPRIVQAWVPGLPVQYSMLAGILVGAAWLITGLMMIFFAQLSRAIFDNANASRDLVAIERARVRQSAN